MGETSPVKGFFAGGGGGICIVLVGHPFDTMKVRLQTQPVAGLGQSLLYTSTWDCAKKIFTKEGLLGFYKGMAAPLASVAPILGLDFWAYHIGKQLQLKRPDEHLTYRQLFLAGGFSGIVTTAVIAPTERVKCLLQVQHSTATAKYKGPIHCAKQIYREGGIRSLYRGTWATLLRDIPASGVYFSVYEILKDMLIPKGKTRKDLSPLTTMFAGGMAGSLYWLAALPPDTLKSRLQTAPEGTFPNGIRDVFRQIVKEEGFTALFKGITPVLLRAFPGHAVCFLGYEVIMKLLNWAEAKMHSI